MNRNPDIAADLQADGTFDRRDRLILALCAQLRAEQETREAIEFTIRNGGLSKEVLIAMASDPVPVVTSQDIAEVERFVSSPKNAVGSRHERAAGETVRRRSPSVEDV